jgi:hypothetical protein
MQNKTPEEDFYIHVLQSQEGPKIPSGVLGNYEIALLYLEKFGTELLEKENWLELNPDAFEIWIQSARWIDLPFNVPELINRIPEIIFEDLNLKNSQIVEIAQLKKIRGKLFLQYSQIEKLPNLEEVGGCLDLSESRIRDLSGLKKVGGWIRLEGSRIFHFPDLIEVEDYIYAEKDNVEYWVDYFRITERVDLAKKIEVW